MSRADFTKVKDKLRQLAKSEQQLKQLARVNPPVPQVTVSFRDAPVTMTHHKGMALALVAKELETQIRGSMRELEDLGVTFD